jgi:hypothetical protein
LNEYAKQAGKQPLLGTRCNILALKFVALILNAQDIDWTKVDEANNLVKEYFKESGKVVDAAGFEKTKISGLDVGFFAPELNKGNPLYTIENMSIGKHRVVIVRIDYNKKAP